MEADGEMLLPNENTAFSTGASLAAKHGANTNDLPSRDIEKILTRLRLGRYDPLTTLSVMLQVNDDIQYDDRYAFCQLIVRYVNVAGEKLVTKVYTHRLPVALSGNDFLDGMDEEVVPIVLGKEAVFRAVVGREEEESIEVLVSDTDQTEILAMEAQKDLDNTIHRISGAFRLVGLEEGSNRRR